jgi:hypothetical protein
MAVAPFPAGELPGKGWNVLLVLLVGQNANLDVVGVHANVNDPFLLKIITTTTTTSSGDHVELIVGQLDRGFDKLVSHLFLQDLPDDCEDFQGSSSLIQNFAFIGEALQKIICWTLQAPEQSLRRKVSHLLLQYSKLNLLITIVNDHQHATHITDIGHFSYTFYDVHEHIAMC